MIHKEGFCVCWCGCYFTNFGTVGYSCSVCMLIVVVETRLSTDWLFLHDSIVYGWGIGGLGCVVVDKFGYCGLCVGCV